MPNSPSLTAKLLRYFSFAWMLRLPEGDMFLKASIQRENRRLLQRWLPHYLKVHGVLLVLAGLSFWLLKQQTSDLFWLSGVAAWCGAECTVVVALASAMMGIALNEADQS